jgi:hypothetical protein
MDIQPTPESARHMREIQEVIQRYEEGKKLREKYPDLKRRLDAIRESKPTPENNFKDIRAIEHFELLHNQHESKLKSNLEYRQKIQTEYDTKISRLKEEIEPRIKALEATRDKLLEQMIVGENHIREKMSYVGDKLEKAKGRMESVKNIKTKEEILVEKQIVELVEKHKLLEPNLDVTLSFPGFKEMNLIPPPLPKAKRKAKEVPPDPPLEVPVEEPEEKKEEPVPVVETEPPKTEPRFGNLITNTKLKKAQRVQKPN